MWPASDGRWAAPGAAVLRVGRRSAAGGHADRHPDPQKPGCHPGRSAGAGAHPRHVHDRRSRSKRCRRSGRTGSPRAPASIRVRRPRRTVGSESPRAACRLGARSKSCPTVNSRARAVWPWGPAGRASWPRPRCSTPPFRGIDTDPSCNKSRCMRRPGRSPPGCQTEGPADSFQPVRSLIGVAGLQPGLRAQRRRSSRGQTGESAMNAIVRASRNFRAIRVSDQFGADARGRATAGPSDAAESGQEEQSASADSERPRVLLVRESGHTASSSGVAA